MGGDLGSRPSGAGAPTFIAAAWRDDSVKTNLQQIQIVKGWVTAGGEKHEKVYRVAGRRGNPLKAKNDVNPGTCSAYPHLGRRRLCAVWQDPHFKSSEHAFYYVRVLEEPVCRYSTRWCRQRIGVDPLFPDQCSNKLNAMMNGTPEERLRANRGTQCCLNDEGDQTSHIVQPVIQERAWTSPIWYEPAG